MQGKSSALADTLHSIHTDELVRVLAVCPMHYRLRLYRASEASRTSGSTVSGRHRTATTTTALRSGLLCSRTVVSGKYSLDHALRTVSGL